VPIAYVVTLYGCCWKCGGRRTTKRELIEKHEQTCFANPARRACKTCKHDHKSPDPEDCYCAIGDGELREIDGATLTCRADCPGWEPKA